MSWRLSSKESGCAEGAGRWESWSKVHSGKRRVTSAKRLGRRRRKFAAAILGHTGIDRQPGPVHPPLWRRHFLRRSRYQIRPAIPFSIARGALPLGAWLMANAAAPFSATLLLSHAPLGPHSGICPSSSRCCLPGSRMTVCGPARAPRVRCRKCSPTNGIYLFSGGTFAIGCGDPSMRI